MIVPASSIQTMRSGVTVPVSRSMRIATTNAPALHTSPSGLKKRVASRPGSLPGGRPCPRYANSATRASATVRPGAPTTPKPPSTVTTSSTAASSSEAARRRAFSRTSRAASASADPPSAVLRLPNVPIPWGAPCVSPWRTVTASGATPSSSATIWANVVSCPWPCALEPVIASTAPVASTRMSPLSQPRPEGSTYAATPMPTISPRARRAVWARRSPA